MTIFSAGTLCAGPPSLQPGDPRSYNVLEVDRDKLTGRLHQRRMSNLDFLQPIWTAGHFTVSQRSFIHFNICPPLAGRPDKLDQALVLEHAEEQLRVGTPAEAIELLLPYKNESLARPLFIEAISKLSDDRRTIELLPEPTTPNEIVLVGTALLEVGTKTEVSGFLQSEFITSSTDASVQEVIKRLRRRVRQ